MARFISSNMATDPTKMPRTPSLDSDEPYWYGSHHSAEHANDCDLSRCSHGVHGAGESFAAADFENDIDAFAAREPKNLFVPLRRCFVVDGLVRAERFGSRQLFIAAGGNDHARAVQFGELETEDRHAAGSKK